MAEAVKGLTVELGLDTTELKKGLKETQTELKKEQNELKEINKNMKYDTKPLDSWRQKVEKLKQIQATLNKELEEAKEILKKTEEASRKGLVDASEVEKARAKVQQLNSQLTTTNLQLEQGNKKVSDLKSADLKSVATGIGTAFTAVLATITAVITGIAKIASSTASAINTINESASNAGLDVESYQRLTYATNQLYVSESSVATAMSKVNGMLGDLATGDGLESAQILTKIGLSYKDIASMDTEDAFYAIIDALGEMDDQTEALAYANDLFGDKLGTKLLPLIKAGSTSLKDMGKNATVLTEEQTELANQYDTEMTDLKSQFTAMGAEILPMVNDVILEITDAVKNDIAPVVSDVFSALNEWKNSEGYDAVVTIISSVGRLVTSLLPALKGIINLINPMLTEVANGLDGITKYLEPFIELLGNIIEKISEIVNFFTGDDTILGKISSVLFQNPLQTIGNLFDSWFNNSDSGSSSGNTTTNNTSKNYNVTINTSASSVSLDEIDATFGTAI